MMYTVFDKTSGRLKMRSITPHTELPDLNDIVVEGFYEPNRHYIDPKTLEIHDAGIAEPFYYLDGVNGWVFDDKEADVHFRQIRNDLLRDSDWAELPSAASRVDSQAWAAYRQDLRDITEQIGYPKEIKWPERP